MLRNTSPIRNTVLEGMVQISEYSETSTCDTFRDLKREDSVPVTLPYPVTTEHRTAATWLKRL